MLRPAALLALLACADAPPAADANAAVCWAAHEAVEFAPLPQPLKGALRILELQGQAPVLAEVGLLAPGGDALCVLLLAHSEGDGRLLLVYWAGAEGGRLHARSPPVALADSGPPGLPLPFTRANLMGDKGASALAECLERNTTLTTLDLA